MQTQQPTESKISDFQCPIGGEVMSNPVVGVTGRSFELANIKKWILSNHNDPFDPKRQLEVDQLIPNHALKQSIQDYKTLQEQKITLKEIYLQRGKEKIAALETQLTKINFDFLTAHESKSDEFKAMSEACIWPFPFICPRGYTLIKDPVIAQDGTTYQRTMTRNLKQPLLPNIILKNCSELFPLEVDNELIDQCKQIKILKRKIDEKIEEFERTLMAKFNKCKMNFKKIPHNKKVRKYCLNLSLGVSFPYLVSLIMHYFLREDLKNYNQLSSPENQWNASTALMQPVITTAYSISFLINDLGNNPTKEDYQKLRFNLLQCGIQDGISYADHCAWVIRFGIKFRRHNLLMKIREIEIEHFRNVACDTITYSDFEGLKILYRLNPAVLDDNRLLNIAANNNKVEIVNFLLDHGFSVDRTIKNVRTPLQLAVEFGHIETATILINRGASLTADNGHGNPLAIAIAKNNLVIVEIIVKKDPQLAKTLLTDDSRLIQRAIDNKNIDLIKFLFAYYPVNGIQYLNTEMLKRATEGPVTPELMGVIVERMAECKDFEEQVAKININYDYLPLVQSTEFFARVFAVLINAGYQVDQNSKTILSQELLMKSLAELSKLSKLNETHCKIALRQKGLEGMIVYAAQNGQSGVVKEILKLQSVSRDAVKQAMLKAHKNHSNTYNLLRNHLRILDASLVSSSYSFYQPSAKNQNVFSKQSQRAVIRSR